MAEETTSEDTRALPARSTRAGAVAATLAFLIWAGFPVYFKAVADVPAAEVLAHRIAWSAGFVALLLVILRQWREVRRILGNPRQVAGLAVSGLLVACNWLIFIWAVAHDRVLESSLGYFINPLLNVALGVLILGERLRRAQWLAIALAALGVANLVLRHGQIPWVAISLAATFGLYGLMRKQIAVKALAGLFVETMLLLPVAAGYLVYLGLAGLGQFGTRGIAFDGLLALAGVFTALPLILFAAAARRLPLSTLGQLQYTVPTGHFLLAVVAFGEPFTAVHGVTFGCIWVALALYAWDSFRVQRHAPRMSPGDAATGSG